MAPVDPEIHGSPGWRLKRLTDQLVANAADYQALDDYYTGAALCRPLTSGTQRDAYRRLLHLARMNYAELIVEAPRERLKVVNFRTGAEGDQNGDKEAWRIWQANQLDADSSIVHRWSLTMRDAFVMVGDVDAEIGAPLISIEDPRYIACEFDPVRRRKVTAAVKFKRDDDLGADLAYLYLLDGRDAWVLRAGRPTNQSTALVSIDGLEWIDQRRLRVPRVPIVAFRNRFADRSYGEFEGHTPAIDRINYQILSRLEITTLQAFRQRAAKGGPTRDPETGAEIDYSDIFRSAPGAIWHLPEGMELWESGVVDLTSIRSVIEDDVKGLALATRTPLYYMTADSANQSAEGASLAREGLVYKAEDRQGEFGESWEQVMSLAFAYQGDTVRASTLDMEVVWAPVERFSLAERYDAASKAADILPKRTIRTDVLQFSPQDADRMDAEDATSALLAPDPLTIDRSTPGAPPVAARA